MVSAESGQEETSFLIHLNKSYYAFMPWATFWIIEQASFIWKYESVHASSYGPIELILFYNEIFCG